MAIAIHFERDDGRFMGAGWGEGEVKSERRVQTHDSRGAIDDIALRGTPEQIDIGDSGWIAWDLLLGSHGISWV